MTGQVQPDSTQRSSLPSYVIGAVAYMSLSCGAPPSSLLFLVA